MTASPTSLASSACLVARQTGSVLRGLRFLARSCLRYRVTSAWLRFIDRAPYLAEASERVRGVLTDKIHRPFSHCAYGPAERAAMLAEHYTIAETLFAKEQLLALVMGERLVLARLIEKKTGKTYLFTLAREMISQHQGELTFLMLDEAGSIPLAMLMVNLTLNEAGERTLLLNGIQGPGAEYKSRIVRVTRDLSGLRPKRAVLEAAYAFAQAAGCKQIVATALANHVSQAKLKWQRKIHADYDDFWREFLPTILPNGDFAMPAVLPRRQLEEVAGKKRKAWLERQALLQDVATQTAQRLAAFSPYFTSPAPSPRAAFNCSSES